MLASILIALIRIYQRTLSRLLYAAFGPICRFEPSCSAYAAACIAGQGALYGSLLSAKCLCKCHPFHPGGYDPPPPPRPRHERRTITSGPRAAPTTTGQELAPTPGASTAPVTTTRLATAVSLVPGATAGFESPSELPGAEPRNGPPLTHEVPEGR